jgi:hypothetical protein
VRSDSQLICRSAGLEEYIEGLSFLHYLEHGTLISLKEVQDTLSEKETGESVRLVKSPCYSD